jgi:hypothetical protein
MKKPNIFKYATSELSQDAFIAWLLEWASPENKLQDELLYKIGLDFLGSLLAKQNILIDKISKLEIKTQYNKIDVFVSFTMQNKKFGIIIEDKVFTSNHSGQLKKYKSFIENKNFDVVIPIYFKTGFQHCYKDVIDKGYHPYTIKEFSVVLKKGKLKGINNAIFLNYLEYLEEREKWFDDAKFTFDNYKSVNVSEWSWWSCVGFFNDYNKQFNAGWSIVSNNRQPLLAFWFGHRHLYVSDKANNNLTLKPYIDILCSEYIIKINFRLDLNGETQTNNKLRNKIFTAFQPYLEKAEIKYKKATFRKAKKTILLAQIIDFESSINHIGLRDNLIKYKKVLDVFVNDYNQLQKSV